MSNLIYLSCFVTESDPTLSGRGFNGTAISFPLAPRVAYTVSLSITIIMHFINFNCYLFVFTMKFTERSLDWSLTAWSTVIYACRINRRRCGFKTRRITSAKGFTFCYAERGIRGSPRDPTIVLIPGLGGTIENWVPVIKVSITWVTSDQILQRQEAMFFYVYQ